MTQHDSRTTLVHMLEYASRALKFGGGFSAAELQKDEMRALAVTHALVIVGEATRATPELRDQFPEIPWADTVRMRNRIIHGYDTVEYEIVADTIQEDLPALLEALQQALGSVER